MRASWKIKKVPMRKYLYFKALYALETPFNMYQANWGGVLITKRHNPGEEAGPSYLVYIRVSG